jgi:hypothetical protein
MSQAFRKCARHQPFLLSLSSLTKRQCRSLISQTTPWMTKQSSQNLEDGDSYRKDRINSNISHSFPDFIEQWNRDTFRRFGYGMTGVTLCSAAIPPLMGLPVSAFLPAALMGLLTAGYWRVGLTDIRQTSHAVRRNYPVIGNLRYILEMVRVWIRFRWEQMAIVIASKKPFAYFFFSDATRITSIYCGIGPRWSTI